MKQDGFNKGQTANDPFDIIIMGGGINGAGIAADASSRGLSVGLYEAKDFASGTSSASTKLIHGGLRYLEHYQFSLVRESLIERDILRRKAPHIIQPIRFCLPHCKLSRPSWLLRTGLFIYDHLYFSNTMEKSVRVNLKNDKTLKSFITKGFEYSDCQVDDSRLVILNILDAQSKGAEVKNYCPVIKARAKDKCWEITIKNTITDHVFKRFSRTLINVTGPWIQETARDILNMIPETKPNLVKGSHILVENTGLLDKNYLLQNHDGRVIFVIGYLDTFLLIGTTDINYNGSLSTVEINQEEIDYLLKAYNAYFKKALTTSDIKFSWSGIRPLYDNKDSPPSQLSRDYRIIQKTTNHLPAVLIYGGKITTYRKLAENALKKLNSYFPDIKNTGTRDSYLPGSNKDFSKNKLIHLLVKDFQMTSRTAQRLASTYGNLSVPMLTQTDKTLAECEHFGEGLTEIEVDYLIKHEMVKTVDDILWRRTKLGFLLSKKNISKLSQYMKATE